MSQTHRNKEAKRDREKNESIRNIGIIPRIKNISRRNLCEKDLAKFIFTYAPEGKDPFSNDHIRVIHRIENAIFHGGRFVEAVYRGFGKSTISNISAVWALVYGHRRFIPLIRANGEAAKDGINAIKLIFESELLSEDFPEICYPIQRLEGITQRAHAQLYINQKEESELTRMEWSSGCLILPMTDGAVDENGEFHKNKACGSALLACGITSSKLRGLNKRRGDGVELRPDFAIIDDPQDEESAASPLQVTKRLNILKKAIIRSAGHKTGMAAIMPCTVICKDDLVDQLLDFEKNPAWQGERIPFVRKWPDAHESHWLTKYKDIRTDYNPDDPDDFIRARIAATEYYRQNQEIMDAGGEVSWSHCFAESEHEISSLQHAYNALIDDGEEAFASEFQNEPFLPPEEDGQLAIETVWQRIQPNLSRGEIPTTCETITAFIDVQQTCLYWVICAWSQGFTGYIVDYGVFPQQNRNYFALRDVKHTLMHRYSGSGQEGAWRKGFEELTEIILGKEYIRDDGTPLRITRCLIDANDGNAAQTVFDFCRQSKFATIVMPARGRGVTASGTPFSDYKRKPGDKVSPFNWRIPASTGKTTGRYILSDVNFWKSFVRSRWHTTTGDPGCLNLFGKEKNDAAASHLMFGEHMVSEYSVKTEGRGRTVDEWSLRPNRENHWFDGMVGCAIAASEQGIMLESQSANRKYRRDTVSARERLSRLGRVIS